MDLQTSGQHSILESLIRTDYAGLRALLIKRAGDRDLAEEILSESIALTWSHLQSGRLARPQEAAGYVFRVAMNLLRNHRRRIDNQAGRRAEAVQLDELADDSPGGRDPFREALLPQVRQLIGQLPTVRDRELVKRFYLDEDQKDDICRELGLAPLHFDKVIFRARQRLRALLEAHGFSKSDFFGVLLACCNC
jgi:RNA polymerase sigma-70 factor, ECF subfamily